MQRWYFAALVSLFFTATLIAQDAHPGQPPFEPRALTPVSQTQFFLKLHTQLPAGTLQTGITELDKALADMGLRYIQPVVRQNGLLKAGAEIPSIMRLYKVTVAPQEDMRAQIAALSTIEGVEYASPYFAHKLAYTPDDPDFSGQWELTQLQAAEAWDVTQGDSTMAIGLVDTGVDLFHPDLSLNIYTNSGEWGTSGELSNNGVDDDNNGFVDDWRGWDFIGTGNMASPAPDNEPQDNQIAHGTGVAGAASAVTDNADGIAGIGFRTKILPVKVAGDQSDGVEAGYDGILYAIEMGCPVIVCGWELDYEQDIAMREIVDYGFEHGSLIVVAGGNEQTDIDLSRKNAVIQRTLHAGGTTKNSGVAFFSNRGISIDVFAPASGVQVLKKDGGTEVLDGTSYSAGFAAGVAALVKSVHPDWTPDQIAKQMRVTSVPFSSGRRPDAYGILNAYNAVTMNDNLDEIPGLVMRGVEVDYPGGDGFTAIGQTATVKAWIVNLLAPTSAQASAELTLSDNQVSSPTTTIPIGALGTYDSVQIQFNVTLTDEALYTAAVIPFSITITDGEYIDYAVNYLQYSGIDGWQLSYDSDGGHAVRALSAVSENLVWAVLQTSIYNYSIVRTTDGGATWEDRAGNGFPTDYRVRALSALDENTAYVGIWADGPVDAGVYRTTDGGENWERYALTGVTDFVNFVHMFDANEGVVEGDALDGSWGIAKTYDAGGTWTLLQNRPSAVGEVGVTGAYAFNGGTGFFGTYNKKMYMTTDKGETWSAVATPAQNIGGISMRNDHDVLVRFFNDGTAGQNMFAYSTDAGANWTDVAPSTPKGFGVVILEPNGDRMWIGMNDGMYLSRDDGTTWTWDRLPQMPVGIFGVSDVVSDGNTTWAYVAGTEIFKRTLPYAPLGTGRVPAAGAFRVEAWPNPVANGSQLTLSVHAERPGAMQCTVYDLYGRRVHTQQFEAGHGETFLNVPTSGLAAGQYTATVRSGNTQHALRITVLK